MNGPTGPEHDGAITVALAECLSTWYTVAKLDPLSPGATYWGKEHDRACVALYAAIADWHRREMKGEWTLGTRDREIAEGLNDG